MFHGFGNPKEIDQALAAFGLVAAEPVEAEHLDIWPENMGAFMCFRAMATQWQVGASGPVGLRMEALPFVLQTQGIKRAEWAEAAEGLQVLERETLRLIHNQK